MIEKSSGREASVSNRWLMWVAVFLLWSVFAQAARSGVLLSLTTDEGLHITSGYAYLRTGDTRLMEEHPPLTKSLAAWPLLLVPDLPSPASLPGWADSDLVRVMKHCLHPYHPFDRVVYAARVPIMLLSLLLGAMVFRWASDLSGPRAGLLALGLYALDPNILAHAPLAATDLGAAAFVFFALYTFWRALRSPSRVNVVLAGIALGLAQAAKISAIILLPLFIVLAGLRALTTGAPALLSSLGVRRWAHTAGLGQRLVRLELLAGVIFVLAGVTLWATYGFELRTLPGGGFPMPAASHLIPFERVRTDLSAGRTTFLMGQYSQRGWWYYFLVAFTIKTPLPTLFLLIVSIIGFVTRNVHHTCQKAGFSDPQDSGSRKPGFLGGRAWLTGNNHTWGVLALVTFPLVYFIATLAQPFNIGYRHLLPVLPFTFVFIGVQISDFKIVTSYVPYFGRRVSRITYHVSRITFYVLLFWYIVIAVRIFPHHLAYFNELVGGPEGGYHYLVDSNLDWGQAWKELKTYMDTHGIDRIKFAQFSSNDPVTYGIDYEPIAPMTGALSVLPARFNPAPGVYVISASSLQGLNLADINTYDYFRHRTPTARIGYALFVYDIQPIEPPPQWVALCAAPAPPLEPKHVAFGFGRNDLRLVYFDCQQTWVLPGDSPKGWVVLPYAAAHNEADAPHSADASHPGAFVQGWRANQMFALQSELVFEQKQSLSRPPHSIFLTSSREAALMVEGTLPISATVGGVAELVGYALDYTRARPGQSVELVTLWRVVGQPPDMLSVMAHLIASDGRAIAVGDGLGFTAEQWQVGDVFAQRNLLAIPPDAPAGTAWVQTGLYTLGDMRRLEITQGDVVVERTQGVRDTLRLAPVDVEP